MISNKSGAFMFFIAALCFVVTAGCKVDGDRLTVPDENAESTTWYVDINATGAGTGESWADAFTDIQSAVDTAASGDKVFVAQGVYSHNGAPALIDPGVKQPLTDPVLIMKNGVAIYGGFEGKEQKLADRLDPTLFPTILDGDHTSYHVVQGASKARLDGFLVRYGYAFGAGNDASGGGMLNYEINNLEIRNCVFDSNYADGHAGGIFNDTSNVTISNSVFNDNFCSSFGGGIFNLSSTVSFDYVLFTYNNAYYYKYTFPTMFDFDGRGGGLANSSSDISITNSYFYQNGAGVMGGGIFNGGSNIEIHNNYFVNNSTYNSEYLDWGGGAIGNMATDGYIGNNVIEGNSSNFYGAIDSSGSSLMLSDNIFHGNTQGAVSNFDCDSITIENSVFEANSRNWNGGAITNFASPTTILNCMFNGNKAYGADGGSVVYNVYGYVEIINSTLSGNTTYNTNAEGGAVHNYYYSDMVISDSILWGNLASYGHNEIFVDGISTITVTYSDVEMSPASVYPGAGNINDDPLFMTGAGVGVANDFFLMQTATGDAAQSSDSPCVDAGSIAASSVGLDDKTTRTDGVPDAGVVDMGFHR